MSQVPEFFDRYGGVIVDLTKEPTPQDGATPAPLPSSVEEMSSLLPKAVEKWQAEGKRGLWIKIPTKLAAFVSVCADNGFEFHHAKPGYVMMTRWLPDSPSHLPNYSFTQIGVGGLVFNSEGKLLAVQEKVSPLAKFQGFWKLPGGLADPKENIGEVAAREVFEETGVRCKPESIVIFRHTHNVAHGQGDIYFVVRCKAEEGGTEITPCEAEIAKAEWMSVDDYLSAENVGFLNKRVLKSALAQDPQSAIVFTEMPDVRGEGWKPSTVWEPACSKAALEQKPNM